MTAKAVVDNPWERYVKVRLLVDERVLAGSVTIEEAIHGFQRILDGEEGMRWQDATSDDARSELTQRALVIINAIIAESAKTGKDVLITKDQWAVSDTLYLYARPKGLIESVDPDFINRPKRIAWRYESQTEKKSAILHYKPELTELRKVLRGLKEAVKDKTS